MEKYKIKILGTEDYDNGESGQYGDCIFIYNDNNAIVYDCGSEKHAEIIVNILANMKTDMVEKVDVIISHNDSDHTNGVLTLVRSGYVRYVFTTLLLKYTDEILKLLDDERRTNKATKEHILELYDNIAKVPVDFLVDVYELLDKKGNKVSLPSGIQFIGPDKNTMIETASKAIKENDLQTKDGQETLVNATSLQISVILENDNKLLLMGDASPDNVKCDFNDYKNIQLPHHGKLDSAEAIFDKIPKKDISEYTFIISDNTGNTNGGSNKLMESEARKGKRIKNTKKDGTIEIGAKLKINTVSEARKNYGICSGI